MNIKDRIDKESNTTWSIDYSGLGMTSKKDVSVHISPKAPGTGIIFKIKQAQGEIEIPASCNYVVNTLRNVVLGKDNIRLCIVEHFLAATSLWGLSDILVTVDGPEMPLEDGSALLWIDLFKKAGIERKIIEPTISLKEPIICSKGDRFVIALPDEKFSISYFMDWNHPKIGKRWQSWNTDVDPLDILSARTFGSLKEHQMLGFNEQVVSLTEDDFSKELRFIDEPVRHKLLDLAGDLALSGVNPLAFKAKFLSIKAGHELDVEMAKRLSKLIS